MCEVLRNEKGEVIGSYMPMVPGWEKYVEAPSDVSGDDCSGCIISGVRPDVRSETIS